MISLSYSGTNSFGGTIEDSSFQTISDEFKNPWYELSLLTGHVESGINNYEFYKFYIDASSKEVDLDADKIMYFINEDVRN